MKKSLGIALAFSLLIGGVQATSAAPNYLSLYQPMIAWKTGTSELSSVQKSFLSRWIGAHKGNLVAASCEATYKPSSTRGQLTLWRDRATKTCQAIKKIDPKILTKVVIRKGTSQANDSSVKIRFTKNSQGSSEPAATASPSASSPAFANLEVGLESSLPAEQCKITSTGSGWNTVGFPITTRFGGRETYKTLPSSGKIKAIVIGVDFPNYPGVTDPATYVSGPTSKTNDFYKTMSYGQVEFEFTVLPKYVRMGRNAESYGIGTWGSGDYGAFYREALANAARSFDIRGYDVAYVMASPETPASAITPGPGFPAPEMTEDGVVPLGTATGGMPFSEPAFRWMAHETGHLFGFVDLYDVSGRDHPSGLRHLNFGWWDIMSMNWETFSLELNGWFRFQVGWLPDNSVLCFKANNLSEATIAISNLSEVSGRRLIVVRLDQQRAIAFERRSITRYAPMPVTRNNRSVEGVLVYHIDGAKDFQMAPVKIIKKAYVLETDQVLALAAFQKGESATAFGLQFEVKDESQDSSLIRIRSQGAG